MSEWGIGKPVRRREDDRFIRGRGQYTDDINRPNQTHAVFVRSPHAHALIRSIDLEEANAAPGVVAVFTGKDVAEDGLAGLICGWTVHSKDGSEMKAGGHPILAAEKVRYVGDHVALVIAETKAQALAAADLVLVDYEPLPAVSLKNSTEPGSAQVHEEAPGNLCFEWELGDKTATEEAFSKAARTVSIDLANNRLVPNAMEPRAAIGDYDAGRDEYTLWTTSQNPHVARLVLSAFVGVAPEHKLRVIAPDVGGGFGSKIFIYPEETACAWASKKIGRPIKWTADRSEAFLADAHGRDHLSHAELALDEDGKFLGLKVKTKANLGAYLSTFSAAVPTYLYGTLLSGQYDIPAIYVEVDGVYTTTSPVDAYRGAGRPEATYIVERIVETAARENGFDPAEIRRMNFVKTFPHQTPVIMNYDIGDFEASLDKALEVADYAGFPDRKEEAAKRGKLRGIGFSTYIEACGIAPSAAVGSLGAGVGLWESAEVQVAPTGKIEVFTGSHSHGQGHETTFAQLVSERTGLPLEDIEIIHGDTGRVQFGMGTYGSRSGAVGMSAIFKAIDKVEAKARKIAAQLMEAAEDDVVLENGAFTVKGTDKSLSWPEVTLAAYTGHGFDTAEIEPGLKESAFYDPLNFTFPSGCHICEIEIDPETGVTEIVNFTAIDDFGTIINPMIVEGQVHGGLVQGIGQALYEHGIYDEESGQLMTGSFMDYCMPRADNFPGFKLGFTPTVCPSNPMGMKGCGEAGAIGSPPAVINAITDALGIKDIPMPATPARVWAAIQNSATPKAA
ncbi:molybdopterin-binding aldehyde oxidase and xanthine dehydrogenase [Tepidicaulis marinus]|uniref:Molybdopterin-binding aldehyde oxidase and xanthine dehydrogenase n=1 Tax=Tepidicaulis marinus TaxID=1333998 RepID=A0A081B7P6_9HYPH|nr:xanthine dehydrogenase family protein molybdopterin-binding subunit [Tepidicaulis marinus]GAK44064.1 molybdopterin-binding aldehyde oxidase and xanthine dehydrogenase [Tepidicaulis marinus]